MIFRSSRLPGAAVLVLALTTACSGTGSSGPAAATPSASGAPQAVQVTPGPPPPPGATGAPVAAISSLPPVPVGQPAAFGGGLVAKVATIDPIDVNAQGPGEIAGPGVAVNVDLSNESKDPIDLGGVVVNAYYGGGTPAGSTAGAPAAPAAGPLAPGETKRGVYVFQVPRAQAGSLVVEVNYSGSPNVVLIRR